MSKITAEQISEQALAEREYKDIIVVDTREFSCTTPIFLAEKNFWLVRISRNRAAKVLFSIVRSI